MIPATFDYIKNAGFVGTVFENSTSEVSEAVNNYMFNFSISLSENPAPGIVPMQREEFTRRILKTSSNI